MSKEKRIISSSPDETISAGYEFAKSLKPNDVAGLFGNLGSGKTQFVKGVCKFFNVKDPVTSPTFAIVNEYKGMAQDFGNIISINHFDLYRLNKIEELREIGIENYVNDESICLIEWAEIADKHFKGNLKKVYFDYGENENKRIIFFNDQLGIKN